MSEGKPVELRRGTRTRALLARLDLEAGKALTPPYIAETIVQVVKRDMSEFEALKAYAPQEYMPVNCDTRIEEFYKKLAKTAGIVRTPSLDPVLYEAWLLAKPDLERLAR